MVAVKRKAAGSDKTKLAELAEALVNAGVGGDARALKEIGDRLDGRAHQSVDMKHEAGEGLSALLSGLDRKTRESRE